MGYAFLMKMCSKFCQKDSSSGAMGRAGVGDGVGACGIGPSGAAMWAPANAIAADT